MHREFHLAGEGRRAGHAWPELGGQVGRRATEVQFLVFATRRQEVTDSGLEDGTVRGLANGGGRRGRDQDARWMMGIERPWLLTVLWNDLCFWYQISSTTLMSQKEDTRLE